jgi:NitT/TauT family transport system permease protein
MIPFCWTAPDFRGEHSGQMMIDIRAYRQTIPTIALLIAVFGVWEAVTTLLRVPTYLVPAPSLVLARWTSDFRFFLIEGGVTLLEALAGLLLGGGLALLGALLMSRWRWIERAVLPIAIVAKVTPVVIVAPLFALWFGFGPLPRVLIAALLTFFPVLIGAVSGLRAAPRAARDVFATLNATPYEDAFMLRLPYALPQLFAAVKVSSTLALLGAAIAEWVSGDRGLGRAVLLANSNLDTPGALAGVATIGIFGIALIGLITLLERRVLFWSGDEVAR